MSERKRNVRRICNVFNLTEKTKPRRKTVDYHLLCIKEYKVGLPYFCLNFFEEVKISKKVI